MMFTATWPKEVQQMARTFMKNPIQVGRRLLLAPLLPLLLAPLLPLLLALAAAAAAAAALLLLLLLLLQLRLGLPWM